MPCFAALGRAVLCRQAGNVVHADVMMNPDGTSKGWGIVQFASAQDALNAIQVRHRRAAGVATEAARPAGEPWAALLVVASNAERYMTSNSQLARLGAFASWGAAG